MYAFGSLLDSRLGNLVGIATQTVPGFRRTEVYVSRTTPDKWEYRNLGSPQG
jgi:hypothetical protein